MLTTTSTDVCPCGLKLTPDTDAKPTGTIPTMKNRHAFRPESLGALEDRLVLSRMGAGEVMTLSTVRVERSTADRGTIRFENSFLKGMIPHHQMAIRMAGIAVRNSDNAAVKGLAHRIIAEQRPEIRLMQRFLAHNGVRGFQPSLMGDDRIMLHELRSLQGTAFDRAFLADMTEHHQAAVSGEDGMIGATECLAKASQPGLKQLCGNIISTQTREIAEMQTLLAKAGGVSGMGHGG